MAYNQFTLPMVQERFHLTLASTPDLHPGVPPVPVPAGYRERSESDLPLATTEAGRSVFLIGPLLREVWRAGGDRIALFPGPRFDVDDDAGLVGTCDYVLGLPPQLDFVTGPVVMIVEAKKEDIPGGLGQCAAEMVAARRFNATRHPALDVIHGVVTDGERWRFLRLAGDTVTIETAPRPLARMDHIFGILLHVCGIHPAQAAL